MGVVECCRSPWQGSKFIRTSKARAFGGSAASHDVMPTGASDDSDLCCVERSRASPNGTVSTCQSRRFNLLASSKLVGVFPGDHRRRKKIFYHLSNLNLLISKMTFHASDLGTFGRANSHLFRKPHRLVSTSSPVALDSPSFPVPAALAHTARNRTTELMRLQLQSVVSRAHPTVCAST